ncbi:replication protein RepA [Pelistega sp. MC2]|uniref:replication protein RepA n=1 Tax=Pelistega sp. MC2 TaxID=1720297 RepID=UPI00210D6546|nr:replication protein RepA [Pelistega sp. MC2]
MAVFDGDIFQKERELGFMSRYLAQISLPHSKLNTHYFERTTGLMTLSILSNPKIGCPYGTYPRLLLAWLCTEAVKTQSPILYLGVNQTEFLKKLALRNSGSYIQPLREQTNRLLSSVFRIDFKDKNISGFKNILLADSGFELWIPQKKEWESCIKLNKDFFDSIVQHPVPLDLTILHCLRKSPMTMDVYVWLIYRAYSILVSRNRAVKISWADLQLQFGANYGGEVENEHLTADQLLKKRQKGLYNFKQSFVESLSKIKQYYPNLDSVVSANSRFLIITGARLIK